MIPDYLDAEESKYLLARSDLQAGWLVARTWLGVLGLLAFAEVAPHPISYLLIWILLPGRQLGLAVLMHEAGHGTLFRSRWANQLIGQWLCALPTFNNLNAYAQRHLQHHRKVGTQEDPDLSNYDMYPIDRRSFFRKVIRDLTGQTGFKLLLSSGLFRVAQFSDTGDGDRWILLKQVGFQLCLLGLLMALGIGWTWLLWFGTFMTSYMFVIRLRQIAEHAAVPNANDTDPRLNTRTVDAPRWQLLLVAPNYVNFHMEHHLMPGIPCYHLAHFRTILKRKGLLADIPLFTSYWQVVSHTVMARQS